MILQVTTSSHGSRCLEFHNPSDELRSLIRETLLDNYMESEAYQVRQPSQPFLQCNCDDYILVEFWGRDPNPYVEYLQRRIDEELGED